MIVLSAFCVGVCFVCVVVHAKEGRAWWAAFSALALATNLLAVAALWGAA